MTRAGARAAQASVSRRRGRAALPVTAPAIAGGRLWRLRRWLYVVVLLGSGALAVGLYKLTQIPLPAPRPLAQTSFIYDANGGVLASFSAQNRTDIPLSQVPQVTIDAVVSTEDRHFFSEGAINPVSIVRAALSDLGGGGLQGASTITQQYVKQTYLDPRRTISRKLKEAALSMRVSRVMTKQQILEGYLNTIYWGRGAYGIEAAAETYFGVPASQLDLKESALLAGMIREPDLADPTLDPTTARQNQLDSLRAMLRDHKITLAQEQAAAAAPFSTFVKPPAGPSASAAPAPDGRDYFVEAVRQELVRAYGTSAVDGGGLRVYTTLDPTLQAAAYNNLYGSGPGALNPAGGYDASAALVSIDDNGEVRALVGGQDFHTSAVDLALGAEGGGSGRQPGSTFKAFMLAELIKLGYTPSSVFPAPPKLVVPGADNGKPYTVTNFEGEAPQPQMSIVDATALSINTVYVQVADRIGPANLDDMAAALGVARSELGDNLSEVLGTDEVSPLEMAAAFATFADNGVYHAPLMVTRVTDANGRNLPLPVTPVTRAVLTPAQDAELTAVLQQVVQRGTGTAAGNVGGQVAGKTGTTDNSANAWFVGYTPNLTTAIWMGYPNGFRPMVDYRWHGQYFKSIQGGTIPAVLWHDYMAAAIAGEPQWEGRFPAVYYLAGRVLTPPPAGTVLFPEGLGTTTTSVPPSTTSTSVATTVPAGSGPTTTAAPAPTTTLTRPPPATTPTTTATTVPATTTTRSVP